MWFNSLRRNTQRDAPPALDMVGTVSRDGSTLLAIEPIHRCCMAVVSSCREMLELSPATERNPSNDLPSFSWALSSRTAGDKPEEGGDDVEVIKALSGWATHVLQ